MSESGPEYDIDQPSPISDIWEQFQFPESNDNDIGGDFLIEEKFVPETSQEPFKLFICKFCSKLFKTYSKLEDHLREKCNSLDPHYCPSCSTSFPSSTAYSTHLIQCKNHFKSFEANINGRYPCPIQGCRAELKSKWSLIAHMKGVHSEPRFICQFCGLKFKLLGPKERHEAKSHPNGELEDIQKPPGRTRRGKKRRRSPETRRNPLNSGDFKKNGQNGIESDSDEEMTWSEDSNFQIPRGSSKVRGLEKRRVDPTRLFHCGNCMQSYDSKRDFEGHRETCLQITISGEVIKCKFPECPATFPKDSPGRYNTHLDQKHPNGIEGLCQICGKDFQRNLKSHLGLPHLIPCGGCPLKFVNIDDKFGHWKTKHPELYAQRLECPEPNCTAKFNTKKKLQAHLRAHKKKYTFECPLCFEQYSRVSESKINEHLNGHKIQTFANDPECRICHLFFRDDRSLALHELNCEMHLKRAGKGDSSEDANAIDNLDSTNDDIVILGEVISDAETFPCQDCPMVYRTNFMRRKHQQGVHGLAKEFYHCATCDLVFNQREFLQIHLDTPDHQARLKQKDIAK